MVLLLHIVIIIIGIDSANKNTVAIVHAHTHWACPGRGWPATSNQHVKIKSWQSAGNVPITLGAFSNLDDN